MRIDATFGAIGRFAVRFRWLVVPAADSRLAAPATGAAPAESIQPGPVP